MDKVSQSMMAPGIRESRIIPTGVDLSVFHPSEKRKVRAELRIPQDTKVLLFAAKGIRQNMWRDYRMMRDAVGLAAQHLQGETVLFIGVGEVALEHSQSIERIGEACLQFIAHQDPPDLARYYQAADLYVHAAKADTFPRTILEALACGTPVVATNVGGIPEQVNSIGPAYSSGVTNVTNGTGILVGPGDAEAMAAGIELLFRNDVLLERLSHSAAADARDRFDLEKQVNSYVEWYEDLLFDPALDER
jgi:glycosyltransferase involved in cell wall biosynthesis